MILYKIHTMRILYKFLACFLFTGLLFVSCNEQNDVQNPDQTGEITFVSAVSKHATRLNQDGGQWMAGDQIGIYMTASGQTAAIHYSNIPYTAESSAQATVFKPEATTICYPEEESPADFIAYYPYTAQVADWIYPIDLTDQSASLVAHDLMYATADNDGNGFTSESISLGFTHQLSKLILNLVDEQGDALVPDPDGVTIREMNTTARFDLSTGTLSDAATTADITPYQHGNSSEAILLPCSIGAEHQVIIRVDGHPYLWEMSKNYSGLEMKAGYSYTFKLTVRTSESEIEAVLVDYDGSSITPWGDGGADNKEEVPVEDIEIPADYEIITLPSGGSIYSGLASATAPKVAIVLAEGGSYAENSTFSIPASVTSLMIVGEGGTSAPSVYFGGSMVATEDMDLIHIYNLDLNGPGTGSGYFMNQASLVNIGQVVIERCAIHDIRGVVRLQTAASTIRSYQITNSIIYQIGNYNLLTIDAGSVYEIELSQSTFYNLEGRGVYANNPTDASTVTIDQCTFNQGPFYAIAQFKDAVGGSITFTNNIVGLPYDTTRGVSVWSNATTTSASGNYYVSDTSWQSTAVGENCGYTAAQLFADPDNGDFTQSRLTAGDPRWYSSQKSQ